MNAALRSPYDGSFHPGRELDRASRAHLPRATVLACLLGVVVWCLARTLAPLLVHPVGALVPPPFYIEPYTPIAPASPPAYVPRVPQAPAPSADFHAIPRPVPDTQDPVVRPAEPGAAPGVTPGVRDAARVRGEGVENAPPRPELLPARGVYVYRDQDPQPLFAPKPEYPDIARQAQVEGTVSLDVLVGRDGRVIDVQVARSVPLLDQAAVETIRRWTFRPALVDGHPIAVWVSLPIHFTLH